jgi:hypothetical protein
MRTGGWLGGWLKGAVRAGKSSARTIGRATHEVVLVLGWRSTLVGVRGGRGSFCGGLDAYLWR